MAGPSGTGVTVARGHASAGVVGIASYDDGAGYWRCRKCLAPGSLDRTRTAAPHRIHLVGARDPRTRRVRNGLLHSALDQDALAIRAGRDGRRTYAGDGF